MIRPTAPLPYPSLSRAFRPIALAALGLLLASAPAPRLFAQAPQDKDKAKAEPRKTPGRFFTVTEPITSEVVDQIKAGALQFVKANAAKGIEPTLVFEFRPGETAAGGSDFGTSRTLAEFLSRGIAGADMRVAYVPQPLTGYAALAALACNEIVMGPEGSLGPITPEGLPVANDIKIFLRDLAVERGRDPNLLLGLLDRQADLRMVRTADKQLHYVMAEDLDAFKKTHHVLEEGPAWEGGRRGVLSARRAREQGFARLIASGTQDVVTHYNLVGGSAADDPTLGKDVRPIWVRIDGAIDATLKASLGRRIAQARQDKANLVMFQIDSPGGIDTAADGVADLIANIKDMKTVAFVDDRALGVAVLPVLACDDIVLRKGARLGDVRNLVIGHNETQPLSEGQYKALADAAAYLAEHKGHPVAVARALMSPDSILFEAKDGQTGAPCFVTDVQMRDEPGRYLDPEVRKAPGKPWTISSAEVTTFNLGQVAGDEEEFKGLYGLRGKPIRAIGSTWVDSLVTLLTDPFVSWLLLFIGLFMLVLELKLPGIGLPAITSALAFLLFFWSHYLGGTADQLEIILFIVGMICMALELFVFPGFGVFGMSGVLLILTSIVMASHTFVWPTQEYEYREMGYTLIQVTVAMVAVGGGAAVLARYLPSLPLFNRLVLKPEPWTAVDDPFEKPAIDGSIDSLAFLMGETGRTTTVLRPTGKARFGELLVDVTADGFFIEPDSLVEVIDVQGARVTVKRIGGV